MDRGDSMRGPGDRLPSYGMGGPGGPGGGMPPQYARREDVANFRPLGGMDRQASTELSLR
jgi:hypothetical protein